MFVLLLRRIYEDFVQTLEHTGVKTVTFSCKKTSSLKEFISSIVRFLRFYVHSTKSHVSHFVKAKKTFNTSCVHQQSFNTVMLIQNSEPCQDTAALFCACAGSLLTFLFFLYQSSLIITQPVLWLSECSHGDKLE